MTSTAGKVLVLGRDTRAFLSVVRSLGRRGLQVHVAWCEPGSAAACSRYVHALHPLPPPSLQDLAWRDGLLETLDRERFDFVIPCNDPSLIPLQLRRQDFAAFASSVYLLDDAVFRVVFDKLESYELARSLGIPVARRARLRRLDDLPAALASFPLPVVIKPRASFTPDRLERKHDVRWARSPLEAERHVRDLLPCGDVAVEAAVPGRGVGVEVLARDGEILVAFQHVRLHEPPAGGGSSYRCSTALDPDLLAATAAFLGALRYTGVAMVEFKADPETGTWVFIEVNARFWGSLPLALAAGVDFPFYLYRMWVHGERRFPTGYRAGVRCRNLMKDLAWVRKTWLAGGTGFPAARMPRWRLLVELARIADPRDHSDTFVRDDPRPGLAEASERVRHLHRALARWWAAFCFSHPRLWRGRARCARVTARDAARVLFVCKGNICRSAFAARLAEMLLPPEVQVASAGYHPEPDRPCPPDALRAAAALGVDLSAHRSRVLSRRLLDEADLVFVFDEDNYLTLRRWYPHVAAKIHVLGVLGSRANALIRDPYGGGGRDVGAAYRAIHDSVVALAAARVSSASPHAATRQTGRVIRPAGTRATGRLSR